MLSYQQQFHPTSGPDYNSLMSDHTDVNSPRKRKISELVNGEGEQDSHSPNKRRIISQSDAQIPQQVQNLVRERQVKTGGKVDDKEIGLHAMILCSLVDTPEPASNAPQSPAKALSVTSLLNDSAPVSRPIPPAQSPVSADTKPVTTPSPRSEQEKIPSPASSIAEDDDEDDSSEESGKSSQQQLAGRKKKRHRTTPEQLRTLEETYEKEKMPNQELREKLAKKLGMTPRRVQIWFQNKRAKEKRTKTFSNSPGSPHSEISNSPRANTSPRDGSDNYNINSNPTLLNSFYSSNDSPHRGTNNNSNFITGSTPFSTSQQHLSSSLLPSPIFGGMTSRPAVSTTTNYFSSPTGPKLPSISSDLMFTNMAKPVDFSAKLPPLLHTIRD